MNEIKSISIDRVIYATKDTKLSDPISRKSDSGRDGKKNVCGENYLPGSTGRMRGPPSVIPPTIFGRTADYLRSLKGILPLSLVHLL